MKQILKLLHEQTGQRTALWWPHALPRFLQIWTPDTCTSTDTAKIRPYTLQAKERKAQTENCQTLKTYLMIHAVWQPTESWSLACISRLKDPETFKPSMRCGKLETGFVLWKQSFEDRSRSHIINDTASRYILVQSCLMGSWLEF